MKAIGIICEYNPFHNGHLYHLQEVKRLFPNEVIVLVMSGNFTQRGEPSILSKWEKTKIALHYGVDLVIELPFPFATQSADTFARGAITILKEMQVTHLVFGSESNQVEELIKLAKIQLEDPLYQVEMKKELSLGTNYPTALSKALSKRGKSTIQLPNDILGLSYIREIIRQEANIIPISIKRTNEYNETKLTGTISSATSIRNSLQQGIPVAQAVPSFTKAFLSNNLSFTEDYFPFLRYQIYASWQELEKFQSVDEGIESRIQKGIQKANSYQELISLVKTKRYTYQRLNRMFTHILCQFTKEEAAAFKEITYLRILGFSSKGQKYLNQRKKEVTLPLITKLSSSKDPMLKKEQQVTAIYASPKTVEEFKTLTEKEYQTPPLTENTSK